MLKKLLLLLLAIVPSLVLAQGANIQNVPQSTEVNGTGNILPGIWLSANLPTNPTPIPGTLAYTSDLGEEVVASNYTWMQIFAAGAGAVTQTNAVPLSNKTISNGSILNITNSTTGNQGSFLIEHQLDLTDSNSTSIGSIDFGAYETVTGAAASGQKFGIQGNCYQNASTGATSLVCLGVYGLAEGKSSISGTSLFGMNAAAMLDASVTGYTNVIGFEADMNTRTGSATGNRIGIGSADNGSVTQGSSEDAAFSVYSGGVGWKIGYEISNFGGNAPISSGGTLFKTTGTATVGSFLDFGSYSCSGGKEINFTGFTVDCSGNVTAASVSSPNGLKSPYLLGQTGIPFVYPSSGTIGNNGALSAITALPRTISGGAYFYFPAGAISSGSLAGWYWTVMSSTTAGTIYNSTYAGGQPTVGTTTAFATTGPGAYTQTTSTAIVGPYFTVPGNSMGANGSIELTGIVSFPGNASGKYVALYFGSTQTTGLTLGNSSSFVSAAFAGSVSNRGVTNSQVAAAFSNNTNGDYSPNTGAITTAAVDTTASTTISLRPQINTATDYIIFECVSALMKPN